MLKPSSSTVKSNSADVVLMSNMGTLPSGVLCFRCQRLHLWLHGFIIWARHDFASFMRVPLLRTPPAVSFDARREATRAPKTRTTNMHPFSIIYNILVQDRPHQESEHGKKKRNAVGPRGAALQCPDLSAARSFGRRLQITTIEFLTKSPDKRMLCW